MLGGPRDRPRGLPGLRQAVQVLAFTIAAVVALPAGGVGLLTGRGDTDAGPAVRI